MTALRASPPLTTPTPARRRAVWGLPALGAIVCVLAVVEVLVEAPRSQALGRAIVEALVVGLPMAVGLYAVRSPHHARFGWLLIAASATWSLTALAESSASVPYSIGRVAAWLVFPTLVYLMLAFPRGRIHRRLDRGLFVGVDAVVALLFVGSSLFVATYPLATPWASCRGDCPANAFFVLDRQPPVMGQVVAPVREAVAVALLVAITWTLLDRMRGTSRLGRRSTAPVLVMSAIWSLVLAAYFPIRRLVGDTDVVEAMGLVWALCIPGIATAFLVALMRRRLMVAGALERLSVGLSRDPDPSQLREALAAALGDPGLAVLFPGDGPGQWVDSRGESTSLAAAGEGRRTVMRIDDGDRLCAIVHDPALRDDADLLLAVAALVGTALRHERLKEGLAESLEELADSRTRIARVADVERARIERDLHDGAQQRLIMLRVKLSLAEELLRTDTAAGKTAIGELGVDIDGVLDELRSIAHGVYPSVLNDRGLEDALRSAVADAPVPVDLSVRAVGRHRREIETAVYFTCLEAFQNALKHARATRLRISLRRTGDVLKIEVRDDGVGFEPVAGEHNGGLRNMRDRIEAVGGTLLVDSSPGQGTRIRGTVPIAFDEPVAHTPAPSQHRPPAGLGKRDVRHR